MICLPSAPTQGNCLLVGVLLVTITLRSVIKLHVYPSGQEDFFFFCLSNKASQVALALRICLTVCSAGNTRDAGSVPGLGDDNLL